MKRPRIRLWSAFGHLLAACASAPVLPGDATISLDASELAAGATLALHSESFRTFGEGGVLRLGFSDVPLTRLDDTTLSAIIPESITGSFSPAFVLGKTLISLPSLIVHGYTGVTATPYVFTSSATIGVRAPRPIAIGYAVFDRTKYRFTMLDLETGVASFNDYLVPDVPGEPYGPGPTTADGTYLFYTKGGRAESWLLSSVPTPVEVFSQFPPTAPAFWQAALVGPKRFLRFTKHESSIWDYSGPVPSGGTSIYVEEAWYTRMSPKHDRLVAVGSGRSIETAPVWSLPDGQSAFTIPDFGFVTTAEFSEDGTLLALAGRTRSGVSGPAGRVELRDAATGEMVWNSVMDVRMLSVAFDPDHPFLYLAVSRNEAPSQPVVLIVNYVEKRILGTMAVPAGIEACEDGSCYITAMSVGQSRSLHLLWGGWRSGARVYHFSLAR